MDLLEWAFHKISTRSIERQKVEAEAYTARTENEIIALKTLITFILKGESPPLFAGKGLGRTGVEAVVLPEQMSLFKDRHLNRQILIHKTLAAGIIYKDKISYSKKELTYAERSLEIYQHQQHIKNELSDLFPQYDLFHSHLEKNLQTLYSVKSAFKRFEEADYYTLVKDQKPQSFSRWQGFPERALALWVEPLDYLSSAYKTNPLNHESKTETEKLNQGTEVAGSASTEAIQEVSLKKKKQEQNPVFHAFEKLEAADEYNGGSRVGDSTDELEDHKEALAELNMKHVTREGGGAGSIYKGHFSELFGASLIKTPAPRFNKYKKVPEWNYKTNEFKEDHCRLYLLDGYETTTASDLQIDSKADSKADWVDQLQKDHSTEIENWKHKISSLVNLRKWKDRQLDGPEWNLDAYTRYCADVKASGQGDPKIFVQNLRTERDYHVSILMDLSLSTESWIQNKKVLDIQLESIGLCGLLLKDLNEPISISTTWSETRHHCYVQKIKDFSAPWEHFYQKAGELTPRGYTRLGPALRHAVMELQQTASKKKLLILLTDGKPTDLDHYEGRYGIEDMRHAMIEAEQVGVQVQALAIDSEAKFYFPQIFSKNKYQILSHPKLLPEQLFKIYFNFTRPA